MNLLKRLRFRLAMLTLPRCAYCSALVDMKADRSRKVCVSEDCRSQAALEDELGI